MRIRTQGDYKAFFTDSYKTIRFTSSPPLTPELLDIAINNKCLANCSYCYTNALKSGTNFDNITDKAIEIWSNMSLNDRPFQIAIGGAGEPTLHPDFYNFVKTVKSLEIVPNYTTNGMHLTDIVLEATKKYCGGVALSWHPHIEKIYHKAVIVLDNVKTKLNTHVIIGNEQSFEDLKLLYDMYNEIFDYFVILPYQIAGRAVPINTIEVWLKTFNWIAQKSEKEQQKFAFGALFYDFLITNHLPLNISIYQHHIYSGYMMLDDNYKTIYKSSYELTKKTINCN